MLPHKPFLGTNPAVVPISNSEIGTFKDCKRKWYLSYYLGLGAEQPYTGALAFGTRIHRALELLYKTGEDPIEVWADLIQIQQDAMIEKGLNVDDLVKESELGRIMLEGYLQWVEETGADSDIDIISTEEILAAPLFDGQVELKGKLDIRARRRVDGARFSLDFKSVTSYDLYTKTAHMAEQLKTYQLLDMLNNPDGERIDGGRYRLLKKVKRTSTAKPPFYWDFDVRHNKKTLDAFWRQLHGVIRQMLDLRSQLDGGADPTQVAYPSPSADCSWKCPFYTACPMFDDGSAVVDYVQDNFTQYDPYERYKEENE
jgi:RecB family exonuclease